MNKRKAAYLQITRKCNNECLFCSNPQFEKDYSLEEAKKRILEFKKEGITEIYLTGGEPTTVIFLPEVIVFLKKQKINPIVITNGVRLSEKNLVKELYNSGLRNIHISIHTHKKEIAEKLSQKEGTFEKTIEGIKNAIKEGLDVQINSTINSLNCKELPEQISFFIDNFPEVKHYVFNNLDPGKADGNLMSRAGKNPWIIAKLIDFEIELNKMIEILKKNKKTFRIERVPLCYMQGFEEFSTETRKIIKNEQYICSFIEKNKENEVRRIIPTLLREKIACCEFCKFKEICAGIQPEYLKIYGDKEIFPIFEKSEKIIEKCLEKGEE